MNLPRLIAITAVALSSLASAVPVITEVVASPAPTAGGSTVVIRGTGLGTATFVSIGGISAPISLATSGYIFCTAPAGQGRGLPVQVFEGPIPSNTLNTFSYDIPRVSNFSINSSPTSGGGTLTITGSNFGTSRTVTIGGNVATPTGTSNHTQIQVFIPAGQGLNQPVVINCSGQSNIAAETPSFSYNAPTLTNIISNGFTTAGGTATLSGTNLGLNPQVLVNGVATSIVPGNTHTSLTFNVPAGSGIGNNVVVNVAGQVSTPLSLSYPAPTLSFPSPASGSTAGGYQITINGQNLGPASAASVTIGSQIAPVLASSPGHTSLRVIAPAGQGSNNPISVNSGGQGSTTPSIFSYLPPLILEVSPSVLDVNGGEIVIAGANFGTSPTVLIGGQNAQISFQNHQTIVVNAPALAPGTRTVQVFVQGQPSNNSSVDYVCPADFNQDGSVDFFDYLDFVAAFSTPC